VKKLILVAALAAMPVMTASAQDVSLDSDNDKLSYSLGLLVGERVLKNYGENLNYDAMLAAMKAQHSGEDTLMSMEDAQQQLASYEETRRQEAAAVAVENGKKFLMDNSERDGVQVTDSGLQYEVITAAEGAKPTADDTVSVHYVGTLTALLPAGNRQNSH